MVELPKFNTTAGFIDELKAVRRARKMRANWYKYHVLESDPQFLYRRPSLWVRIKRCFR